MQTYVVYIKTYSLYSINVRACSCRMVNAGGSKSLELVITDVDGFKPADACQVWEIAFDGIYLNHPRHSRLNKTLLAPATRADWIVECHQPGTYEVCRKICLSTV